MGNMYNYYSVAQFIYTAEELAGVDKINSVAFYHNASSMKAQLRIYFVHTTANTVNASNPATEGTLVYSDSGGTVGGSAAGWQTLNCQRHSTMTAPPTSLLLLVEQNTAADGAVVWVGNTLRPQTTSI